MSSAAFDFTPLLPAGLPPPAARWTGRVKFDFTGGNNDADRLPLAGLITSGSRQGLDLVHHTLLARGGKRNRGRFRKIRNCSLSPRESSCQAR